jgi:aspartyl protease family protein
MTSDDSLSAVYLVGALVLVASGLLVRRASWGTTAKMAAAWVAIFAIGFAIFAYRDETTRIFSRLKAEADPASGVVEGGELRLRAREDGHFWVRARINGASAEFLVDSGASTIGLSTATARAAGIDVTNLNYGGVVNTANGPVRVARVRLDQVDVGPIVRRDLAAVVAPEFGETNVIGMNFLSSLSGWRVEDGWLVLRP